MNISVASPAPFDSAAAGDRSLLAADRSLALLSLLLLAILALRVAGLALSNAELYFDEAQYWAWAQQPDWGYYTKPPLIAWLISGATAVCGDSPFCVRLPSPLMHFAISFVIYAIALKLFSPRVAFWAALLYAVMPGTSISATLISTDVPLLLFWSIALLALIHHVEKPSLGAGLVLGAAIGLGLETKYAMIYFVLCYAVCAAVSASARATLRHPGTWVAFAAALLLIAPNLWWNAQHQFATIAHTRANFDWQGQFPNISGLLNFLGTQVAIVSPVPFAAFSLAIGRRVPDIETEPRRLLLATSLPVFVLITAQSVIAQAHGNWAAPGFPAAILLAAAVMVALKWHRGMRFTLIFCAVAFVGITFAGALVGRVTVWPIGGELGKLTGWGDLATKVRAIAETDRLKTVVFAGRGLTASMIYEMRGSGLDIKTYLDNGRAPEDHFELTRPWRPSDKGPVLFVDLGNAPPPAGLTRRARLIENFHTDVVLAKKRDWTASAYRVE